MCDILIVKYVEKNIQQGLITINRAQNKATANKDVSKPK